MKHNLFKYSMLLFMCAASLFFGGIMIYLGVTQYSEIKSRPESCDTVSGFLYDYEVIEKTADGTKYRLEYAYYVGGAEYKLYKEMVMTSEPDLNVRADIICDLYNPENAEFAYDETYPMLIISGAILTVVPIVFILGALIAGGVISFKRISFIEIVMGLVFGGFGLLFCYAVPHGGLTVIFPPAFLAAGVFFLVRGLFFGSSK